MPKIAQHGVDESTIEFTDIQFLSPTESSIVITQKAILHSPSIYTPTLDPFNASLYLVTDGVFASTPMVVVEMPRIHALHPKSNASVDNQNVTIVDIDQVTKYATTVLTNETVTTALTGRTDLHEGKLPVNKVNYNSSTTYLGLNGLKGFNVTGVIVNTSVAAGQPNLKGFAFIPNPSVLTVAMVCLSLSPVTSLALLFGEVQKLIKTQGQRNTLPLNLSRCRRHLDRPRHDDPTRKQLSPHDRDCESDCVDYKP